MRGGALLLLLHPVGLGRRARPTCRQRREEEVGCRLSVEEVGLTLRGRLAHKR
jgi:hypothetical protein